ncbi:type II toxin-antitoxin system VapC family toxin [Roseateles aquatilis]|uniref:type II toxin-antitoxin system VapC family toxin n=1 Tax=Roseateles aquatilis TaxID=431061 RepID=UPI001EDF2449|nr:type II toxin-antitoxin system VapC family toxin [Roseateles aquatilis]
MDTNVLVRIIVRDNVEQAQAAMRLFADAELVVIAVACLCEFAWVLGRSYQYGALDIARAIRSIVAKPTVKVNQMAVDAGLAMLDLGGDFADGAIACEGRISGGQVFMTFDKAALRRLLALGESVGSPHSARAKTQFAA